MIKILFTGGGTGGHTYPIVAVARALKTLAQKENIEVEFAFAGATDFNVEILRQEGMSIYHVPSGKLRRYSSLQAPWDFLKAIAGFFYALSLLWVIMPDVIFAKGGYGSLSVGLAGRIYGTPLLVHDSDAVPGIVNRILGKIASRVAISFPSAVSYFPAHKTAFTGNPVRDFLLKGSKEKAISFFSIHSDRPILLILGGSQGSVPINEVMAKSLQELLHSYEVIHQCGTQNLEAFSKELREIYGVDPEKNSNYHLVGYLGEEAEAHALQAANLVISRAGAGNIYEIAALGKPSILIPLPHAASDHQRQNAFYYARVGATIVIEEPNLSPHILVSEIKVILENPNKYLDMAKAAKIFAKPDAAEKIARGILELALS